MFTESFPPAQFQKRGQERRVQQPVVDPAHVHDVRETGLFGDETEPLVQTRGDDDDRGRGNVSRRLGVVQHQRDRVLPSELRFEKLEHADRIPERSGPVFQHRYV